MRELPPNLLTLHYVIIIKGMTASINTCSTVHPIHVHAVIISSELFSNNNPITRPCQLSLSDLVGVSLPNNFGSKAEVDLGAQDRSRLDQPKSRST